MTKLYEKNEMTFAILWIVGYVVLSSLADRLSESIGVVKSVTAALHIAMSVVLFFWIRKNGLSAKYGLRRSGVPAKRFLYYLPLAVIASTAFWNGRTSKPASNLSTATSAVPARKSRCRITCRCLFDGAFLPSSAPTGTKAGSMAWNFLRTLR